MTTTESGAGSEHDRSVGGGDMRALRELIDEYWSLDYAERKEGRTHDTAASDAQRVSVEIESAIRHLAARQLVGVEPAFYLTQADARHVQTGSTFCSQVVALREPQSKSAVPFYTAPPLKEEPVEYQYRFWIEERDTWSGWAPMRKSDYDRIADAPEEGRQVRALYTAPPAPAAVPVDVEKPNLLLWQLHNQLQHLVRAGRYLEDRVVETRGARCMVDFDHELNQAEKLLATHPQPAAADRGDA